LNRAILFFVGVFVLTTVYTLVFIPRLSDHLLSRPVLFIVPLLAFLSIANIPRLVSKKQYRNAFLFSSLTMSLLLILVAIELYPVLLISSIHRVYNITIYNAASSIRALKTMLIIVLIGAPLVGLYTFFVYRTFRGKVKLDDTSY
jgi:cytochrome d ubiquinol oxidase subunit II